MFYRSNKVRADRRLFCLLIGPAVLSMMPALLAAQNPVSASQRLDLGALVQEAVENNPEIRAAAQRVDASKAMVPQARTLPDPMINLSYEDMQTRETMYGVSQEIPFPGKLRLKGEVASREAAQAEQEYNAVRLDVTARLKEAYFELQLVHRSIEIIEKNQQLLEQFSRTAESGYTVGEMAQTDVFRAQAEVSRSLARLATMRQRQQSVTAELTRILNRSRAEPLNVPSEIRPTPVRRRQAELVDLVDQAPLLLARSEEVERGSAAVELAQREYLPDFEIGVQGVRDEPMGDNGYQVMLNVTVPLYYATKQRYGVKEAIASRAEALGDQQAVRQELIMRVRDDIAQIERAEKLIGLLEKAIIPQAQLTMSSAISGYAVGRVDFLTLLNSLFTLQENELELQSEIVEHEKARARLEEIIGEEP